MAKPRIVITYVPNDDKFATNLAYDLGIWLGDTGANTRTFRVYPNWTETRAVEAAIERAYTNCEWVVVVLSAIALASRGAQLAANGAIQRKNQGVIKGVIFIRPTSLSRMEVPPEWPKWLNFSQLDASTESKYHASLDRILTEVGLPPVVRQMQSDPRLPQLTVATHSQQIFISYRRDDSAAGHAGRLRADLVNRYSEDKVFMDLNIEPGVDFVDTLENAVGSCAVLLAVIGRNWLTVTDAKTGKRRLDNPMDWVRVEIATALRRNIRVIPVLVHRATMPNATELPDDLKPLARRQAHEITDSRWDYDAGGLVKIIDKIVGFMEQTTEPRQSQIVDEDDEDSVPLDEMQMLMETALARGLWHMARNEFNAAHMEFSHVIDVIRDRVIPNLSEFDSDQVAEFEDQYRRAWLGKARVFEAYGEGGSAYAAKQNAQYGWREATNRMNKK